MLTRFSIVSNNLLNYSLLLFVIIILRKTFKRENTMAKPIKETPILRGKEAKHFFAKIRRNETKKISEKDYKRAVSIFERVKEKNKVDF
jgi:hypothetical protein